MTSEVIRGQVLAANRAFYDAFEALDSDAMDACWADGDEVACVHPGGPFILGAGEVRASWAAILAGTGYIEFDVEVLGVSVEDPFAWVTCVERVRAGAGGAPTGMAEVAATNAFVLGPHGWRMVLHHASPMVRPAPG